MFTRVNFAIPSVSAVALLALLVGAPAQAATERWLCARTSHFALYSSSDRDSVLRLARGLERMADVVSRLGISSQGSDNARTVLVALPDKRHFEPNMPVRDGRRQANAGMAMNLPFGNWIAYAEYDPRGRMVAHHEYAHTIVSAIFRHVPLCLNEGLAEFLSTFEASDEDVEYGHPIPWHRYLVQSRDLLSLDELFDVDTESAAYRGGDATNLFYAESWALVHYLASSEGGTIRFIQFAHLIDHGMTPRDAFAQTYPQEDWQRLPGQLKSYIDVAVYHASVVSYSISLASIPVDLREASGGEVATHLGLFRVRAADVDTAGTAELFRQALLEKPDDALALAGRGLLAERANKHDDAMADFHRVAAVSPVAQALEIAGIELLARSLSHTVAPGDTLSIEAYRMLEQSVAVDSTDANALAWFGRAALANGIVNRRVRDALHRATMALEGESQLEEALAFADEHLKSSAEHAEPTEPGSGPEIPENPGPERSIPAAIASETDSPSRSGVTLLSHTLDQGKLEFNRGATAANGKDYEGAIKYFGRAMTLATTVEDRDRASRAVDDLAGVADYNRALAAVRSGDLKTALRLFEQAHRAARRPELQNKAAQRVSDLRAAFAGRPGDEPSRNDRSGRR